MYEERTHSVADRIVNIYRPYARPIPRGKDGAKTEFGAKISAGEVDGFSRAEHIGRGRFNESMGPALQVEAFKSTYGHWPELLLADRIYLNRENRKWLKERNIRIVGKPLGGPPKERPKAHQKRKLKKGRNQRNLIEGQVRPGKERLWVEPYTGQEERYLRELDRGHLLCHEPGKIVENSRHIRYFSCLFQKTGVSRSFPTSRYYSSGYF